ncbi:hypothetical protein DESAMIL20_24 [Desulfurella amilsii]|uniref:Uncharacterized protein n=1 Tax=Desulfurella amilsii TaxID=1562698 RepID=A0A1X4XZG2_9BACT|nr:hypothetical protein [Desulfurella amilsii]OSS42916.1 hypothetical protein DESAMIL20_24 [Desulfurella amilsii]
MTISKLPLLKTTHLIKYLNLLCGFIPKLIATFAGSVIGIENKANEVSGS